MTSAVPYVRLSIATLSVVTLLLGCQVDGATAPAASSRSAPVSETVTRADAASDLRYLVDTIVAVHPNAYFHQPKAALDARLAATIAGLPATESRVEFFKRAAAIVASIGDAHTTLPPYLSEIDDYTDNDGRLFPLVVRFEGANPVVEVDLERGRPVPLGAIVDAIDGHSMTSLVDEIGPLVSTETLALRRSFIAEDFREWLWIEGFRPPYRVTYHVPGAGSATTTLALKGALIDTIADWEASPPGVAYLAPIRFSMLRDGIGDLTMHSFDNADDKFDKLLPRTFYEISKYHPRALIIDIRENDGGTQDVISALMSHLTYKPFRLDSLDVVRASAIVKRSLGKKKYIDLYDEIAWNAPNGTNVTERVDVDEPDDVNSHYYGKVYVLEGPGTFSSAAIFAAAAQDAKIATILGQTSGGLPTLYSNAYDFTLPKTKIDASAATEYSVRPSGDRSERGVVPDRELEPSSELANDTELAEAIQSIEGDIGKP